MILKGQPMYLRPSRLLLGAAAGIAAVAAVAACGSGSPPEPSVPAGTSGATSSPAAAGRGAGRGAAPAASGTIAAVAGTTMQVQSQANGQVAVHWTASTTFTQQVSVPAGSLKAGDCITAIGGPGTSATAASFVAGTVSVRASTNGSCMGGRDGGFPGAGVRPSGARPSGVRTGGTPPSGFPTGGAGSRSRTGFGAIASGSVVSVSGSTLVVASRDFGSGTASPTTTNTTVTLGAATKITAEKSATASAIKVGRCATARGTADSSGTVTATNVAITEPVDGHCGGFGGGFGGAPRFGGAGSNDAASGDAGSDSAGGNGG